MAYLNDQLLEKLRTELGDEKFSELKSQVKAHNVFSEIKTVMTNYGIESDDKRGSANYVLSALIEDFENGDKKTVEMVAETIKTNFPDKIPALKPVVKTTE